MTETADIIDRYVAVWNEPDPAVRRTAIATIWAPGGVEFLEAGTQYRGHQELAERVTRAYEAFVASGKYDVTSGGDAARHDDITGIHGHWSGSDLDRRSSRSARRTGVRTSKLVMRF
jgi:hypothetical protein